MLAISKLRRSASLTFVNSPDSLGSGWTLAGCVLSSCPLVGIGSTLVSDLFPVIRVSEVLLKHSVLIDYEHLL